MRLINSRPGLISLSSVLLLCSVTCRPGRDRRAAPAPACKPPAPSFRFHLSDPGYFRRPHKRQRELIPSYIRLIAHPTPGAPTLVQAGRLVTLWLGRRVSQRGRGLEVSLSTVIARRRLVYPLQVASTRPDKRGALTRVQCRVGPHIPAEIFDLKVTLPGGVSETQQRSVRVLHRRLDTFRFAVLADHQLWDPSVILASGRRNARAYPKRGERQEHRAAARQGLHEVGLQHPVFALHLGDLIFGLDFAKEFRDVLSLWQRARVATFMVPGNHDGYALYGLNLKAGFSRLATGMVRCRKHLPTPPIVWARVWRFLTCMYGDIKDTLFKKLLADGLVFRRRMLGPPFYAFTAGRYRFIALNTYDGTPERRHAYALSIDVRGLHLGAPMVDNYGGYLSLRQLRWLKREMKEATRRGQTVVLFGHHDPRGNKKGAAYHVNESFPTDPVGTDHFEEWNFDGRWDSDPTDKRRRESATRHSGHALLRLLARYGAVYLSGHVHRDGQQTYRPGQTIVPGVKARRKVTFIRVTTASASISPGGYWGYRLFTARADGRIDAKPFMRAPLHRSVPVGNLWVTGEGDPPAGQGVATVTSGLPRQATVRVHAPLPHRPKEGYRFTASTPRARVQLEDVVVLPAGQGGEAIYTLQVTVPPVGFKVVTNPGKVQATRITARPAPGNHAPLVKALLNGQPLGPGQTVRVPRGRCVSIDTSQSRDPDSDPLLSPTISLSSIQGGRGTKQCLKITHSGRHRLTIEIRDAHGALGRLQATLVVSR